MLATFLCACFKSEDNEKYKVKDKYEAVLYLKPDDPPENNLLETNRKPEMLQQISGSSGMVNKSENEKSSNNEKENRRKSVIMNNEDHVQTSLDKLSVKKKHEQKLRASNNSANQILARKISVMEASNTRMKIQEIVGASEPSAKNHRKSVGGISVSRLTSMQASSISKKLKKHHCKHDRPESKIDHTFDEQQHHREIDSITKSQTNNGVIIPADEAYAVVEESKTQQMVFNHKKNLQMMTHKDTLDSASMGTEGLDESVIPPQMIDNSAVLFDHRKAKFVQATSGSKCDMTLNRNSHAGMNDDDQSMVEVKNATGYSQMDASEGKYDGEGEGSSSCS